MTFPIFLALHVAYGALVAFVMEARLRSEGEILGPPLVFALLPVAFVSAPVSALLVRYSANWFLHGALLHDGAFAYERFHLGIMICVAFLAGVATVFGLFVSIAMLSRDWRAPAFVPFVLAAAAVVLVSIFDGATFMTVTGTHTHIWAHPAGWLSALNIVAMGVALYYAKRWFSQPVKRNR